MGESSGQNYGVSCISHSVSKLVCACNLLTHAFRSDAAVALAATPHCGILLANDKLRGCCLPTAARSSRAFIKTEGFC